MTAGYDEERTLADMSESFNAIWGEGGWGWSAAISRRMDDDVEYADISVCAIIKRPYDGVARENRLVWPVKMSEAIVDGDFEAARDAAIARGRLECARQWKTVGDGKSGRKSVKAAAPENAGAPKGERFRPGRKRGGGSGKAKMFRFRRARR